ncbi:M6 family metalloprotease domain-containing protein [Streptomyces fructofermentans]|uniref:Peptidase M6 n=1 Tax=Streptomyces fructofermentans TaxID=152141 RepID=A0A918U3Z0_9ACTN|nr:M6 family metalloprotease domain-containing protein [Streptomyces fructofermentans]GGX89704.1 peptidase M6 [Streptomyces fructofermentans]
MLGAVSRIPHPEVDVPRLLPLKGLTRGGGRPRWRGLARRTDWRAPAAVFTSMSALAATSLFADPSVAVPLSTPCALKRTQAHHSEGLDTWNAAYPRPTRRLDAVMVFLSFPDAEPMTTPAELTADHFPATSRYFDRASYGKFRLRAHPLREWIRMPKSSTAYAIQRDWGAAERSTYLRDALAAADPSVDFSRYDVVYFVADPTAPGVDSDATKVVNLDTPLRADGTDIRRVVTVFEDHPPDRLVLAHETGHVFDLPDLYHRPDDSAGEWDTHVGDWDLMGSQFGLAPDLFGWHKWKLGWLEPRQVVCVRGAGAGGMRLTLEPLAVGPGTYAAGAPAARPGVPGAGSWAPEAGAVGFGSGGGTKLAVVRTGRDSAIAFEARGPVGNDVAACSQGVLVYRIRGTTPSGGGPIEVVDAHPATEACWDDSVYPPLADAPVALGESFSVPGEDVRIAVEDRTASGAWTVSISTR